MSEALPKGSDQLIYEEAFGERRLSDLLPTEFLGQIGLDPNQYYSVHQPSSNRRATAPNLSNIYQITHSYRRMTSYDFESKVKTHIPPNSAGIIAYYEVKIAGKLYPAFSQINVHDNTGGVIVRDGPLLRYGYITKTITKSECIGSTLLIVSPSFEIGEVLTQEEEIATALINGYISARNMPTSVVSVEIVSFLSRSFMRIQLTNQNAFGIDGLVNHLISIFSIAIEIFE